MISSLKELGQGAVRAWDTVAQGGRELMSRSGQALTRFQRSREEDGSVPAPSGRPSYPAWSLLAGEVIDKGSSLVVQLEVPGVSRDDLEIALRDNALHVRGERRYDREHVGGSYYVMERAYGSFERVMPLPERVDVTGPGPSCARACSPSRCPR